MITGKINQISFSFRKTRAPSFSLNARKNHGVSGFLHANKSKKEYTSLLLIFAIFNEKRISFS